MKKISKMITLLLTLAMVFALAACGSGDGGNGGEQANDNPYNLDYKSTEVQPMSDERATKETLMLIYFPSIATVLQKLVSAPA